MTIFGIEISDKIYLPIFIILGAYVLDMIINKILSLRIVVNKKLTKHEQRSRETVLMMCKNIIKVLIAIIAILYILQVYGVNTSALVAGVGAFSLVIGLAFQDVLKDLLVGATIILESQFAIGEIVEINGFKGEVISLTLKTTRLKSYKGEVKIIANRNIGEITNYSLDNVLVRVIASVSYESDNKKVEKVLNELIEKLNTNIPELKSKITIEGIDSLSDSSVDYLLTTKSSVKNEFVVKRKILKEIKTAFDQNGIEIPYPQVEVHNEK